MSEIATRSRALPALRQIDTQSGKTPHLPTRQAVDLLAPARQIWASASPTTWAWGYVHGHYPVLSSASVSVYRHSKTSPESERGPAIVHRATRQTWSCRIDPTAVLRLRNNAALASRSATTS